MLKMIIARKNGDRMYLARPTTARDRFETSPHVEKIEILWRLPISLREISRPAHHLFLMDVVSSKALQPLLHGTLPQLAAHVVIQSMVSGLAHQGAQRVHRLRPTTLRDHLYPHYFHLSI